MIGFALIRRRRVNAWLAERLVWTGLWRQREESPGSWAAFGQWCAELSDQEQMSVAASGQLLEQRGPKLGFLHSNGVHVSKHGHLCELRTQPCPD